MRTSTDEFGGGHNLPLTTLLCGFSSMKTEPPSPILVRKGSIPRRPQVVSENSGGPHSKLRRVKVAADVTRVSPAEQ